MGPIERLSVLDQLMLWASRRWPQHIGALLILEGEPLLDAAGELRIQELRERVASRLHLVPRFRQLILRPRRGLGGPLWVDAPAFDVARHVRQMRLEPPAGEAELVAAIEGLLLAPMDPGQPLWDMRFVVGLPERRIAVLLRIHHSIADGMAAMRTVTRLLDSSPEAPTQAAPPWRPDAPPSSRALLGDNVRRRLRGIGSSLAPLTRPRATLRTVRAAWPAIREILAEEPATATSLDRMVGERRRIALIRSDLSTVRAIGRRHDATVNDVLLSITTAGMREVLLARGEAVDGTTIRIYVPVSLRRHLHGRQEGNLIAQMAVPLRMGLADSERRLDAIAAETRQRKLRARTSLSNLMVGGTIGRRLLLFAVMRQRVNATSASIPGPKQPLYLAGAQVLEVFPLLPLVANEPLGIGALSYAGALTIAIVADRDAFPDFEALGAAVSNELRSLTEQPVAAPSSRVAVAT